MFHISCFIACLIISQSNIIQPFKLGLGEAKANEEEKSPIVATVILR